VYWLLLKTIGKIAAVIIQLSHAAAENVRGTHIPAAYETAFPKRADKAITFTTFSGSKEEAKCAQVCSVQFDIRTSMILSAIASTRA